MSFICRNNIARYRYRLNYSQTTLAAFLGVSKTSVSAWETGLSLPTLPHLFALMDLFQCSFDDLFYRQFKLEEL